MIPDGDFIRLNTFSSDEERMSSISLQLIAGGPVSIADNPIDAKVRNYDLASLVKFAQNKEMLALNADGFVGKPLSDDMSSVNSQIWYGQMKNGDWVVALFNRENSPQQRSVSLAQLGITGQKKMRDLWLHEDVGASDEISVTLPAHGCKVYKLTDN